MFDGEPLSMLGRRVPSTFDRRFVVIEPGCTRMYDKREWDDALVIIEHGELELESTLGVAYRFARGDVLWFIGLALRAMHNRGNEPVMLIALARCRIKN